MTASRSRLVGRWVLGGPVALIAAVTTMASTPLWFPKGAAQVDHLVFAIILFPAYWAAAFFYAVMDASVRRAGVAMGAVIALNAALITASFIRAPADEPAAGAAAEEQERTAP